MTRVSTKSRPPECDRHSRNDRSIRVERDAPHQLNARENAPAPDAKAPPSNRRKSRARTTDRAAIRTSTDAQIDAQCIRDVDTGTAREELLMLVRELWKRFQVYAADYYRKPKTRRPTGEAANIADAMRPVLKHFGRLDAAEFSPLKLARVRDAMIEDGLARNTINARVGRIKRVFAWATSLELIPPTVITALRCVPSLKPGRSDARETADVAPVSPAVLEATIAKLPPTVVEMVRLQLVTGMRPGELLAMRWCDIDTERNPWTYVPSEHKNEHHAMARVVPIGPRGQAILKPRLIALRGDVAGSIAAPGSTEYQHSKLVFTQASGRPFDRRLYRQIIIRAAKRAGVPPWFPNQLRHNAGTTLRARAGREAARVVLGHTDARTTDIYALPDVEAALDVMRKLG